MNKFDKFFTKHGIKIVCVLLILIYFKTCSTVRTAEKVKVQVEVANQKIDSLETIINHKVIETPEMILLIKNTPAWRTLEIEELSDKHHTPINSYKNREEN
ncbi:MAG: hypothetical protein CMP57_03920 [Flavobacteriales bacterium]|nr:hypothetical protein [Flavobacteriales bacterium]|tara:strand:- start:4743 stop:5045 length:303 start_codon:yes stop_codon:yes gene_type:complete